MNKEMSTLRRAIRQGLHKLGWSRRQTIAAGRDLARDLALPPEIVSKILDQAAADLRDIGTADGCLIVNKAVNELAKYGLHSQPLDETALKFHLQQVPEPHLTILRHYRSGMKHGEIAELLQMDKQTVLRSLVKTYADLRMKMIGGQAGEHPETPAPGTTQQPVHAVSRR
jgi:DNA-binding MarR family transcriptional regulator